MSNRLRKEKDRAPAAQPAGPSALEVSTPRTEEPKPLVVDLLSIEPHSAAGIFPMMSEVELEALGRDIKEHGLLQAILVMEEGGKMLVLDGRNRLEACRRVGVEPRFQPWDSKGSPVEYVLSANLHRRQLDTSQRALAAARAKKMIAAEGKSSPDEAPRGKSRDHAAALHGVSPRLVDAASIVLERGVPELISAVERREASVFAAAVVAKLPDEQQRDIMQRAQEKEAKARKKVITEAANAARSGSAGKGAALRPSTWVMDKVRRADEALRELENDVDPSLLESCLSSIEKLAEAVASTPSLNGHAAEVSP